MAGITIVRFQTHAINDFVKKTRVSACQVMHDVRWLFCFTFCQRIIFPGVMSAIVLVCPQTVLLLTGRVLKSLDVAFEAEHSGVAMLSATRSASVMRKAIGSCCHLFANCLCFGWSDKDHCVLQDDDNTEGLRDVSLICTGV